MMFATVIPFIQACVVHADTVHCEQPRLVTLLKTLNLNLKTQLNPINVSVIGGSQTDVTDGGVEIKPAKEREKL